MKRGFVNLMVRKLAQAEIVTVVLLTGVFIASISAVYIWGVPLIEKRQSSSEINAADMLIRDIEKIVLEVALSEGTAQKTISLNLKGPLELNSNTNSINYIIETGHSIYPSTGTLLNDWLSPEQAGVLGSNKPGVISAKSEVLEAGNFRTTYTITYRELANSATKEGIKVAISTPRNTVASAGTHTMSISKKDALVERGKSSLGGSLITNVVDVSLS